MFNRSETATMKPVISYAPSEVAWKGFHPLIDSLVSRSDVRRVCEVGGGANPLLSGFNTKEVEYWVVDVSETELAKTPEQYRTIVGDISSSAFSSPIESECDLVFSRMLAEHVRDGQQFHRNVASLLRTGGIAVHFFPTLYGLPFVMNRLIPEVAAAALLNAFSPRDGYRHAKFPAYYSWCRGPSARQIRRFESLGFRVLSYKGFYGHDGYYRRVPLLQWLHIRKTRFLLKHPNSLLTSYAYVILERR